MESDYTAPSVVPGSPETFWFLYLASLPARHPHRNLPTPQSWGFGDSPTLADELAALVLQGTKTATCSLVWEYEADGESLPQPGDLSIILDGGGKPLGLIETVEVRVRPFKEVDADFAYDEGEDDRSLQSWREGHWRYFGRVCAAMGWTPSPDMPLVCERFRLVWAPAAGSRTR